jgi:hypothetical protein
MLPKYLCEGKYFTYFNIVNCVIVKFMPKQATTPDLKLPITILFENKKFYIYLIC